MKKKELEILVDLQNEYITDLEKDYNTAKTLIDLDTKKIMEDSDTIILLRNIQWNLRNRNISANSDLRDAQNTNDILVLILSISIFANIILGAYAL